ncbi:MAG: hypothetical protein ACJ77A_00715 [Actinomycetota bacterium]
MAKFMVALPVDEGVADEGRKFAGEVNDRFGEFRQSRRRLGVTRERGWLHRTALGEFFVLLLEGDDPVEANRAFAASRDPFDVWFKERAGAILGFDFGVPIPVRPELIYRSAPDLSRAREAMGVVLPIVPGKTEAHRRIAEAVNGPRKAAFDAFHDRARVTEDWWIQETPAGDVVLGYLESDDLPRAMDYLAGSEGEIETWFKQALMETEGIDWAAPPPPLPELLFDWRP